MSSKEHRFSLVGWGHEQVILHALNKKIFLSVWQRKRLQTIADAPWLQGKLAILKVDSVYEHGHADPQNKDFALFMRKEAVTDAVEAIEQQNIHLLSEAVMTTYLAQQVLGAPPMPNMNELCKRYAGGWGVYLFSDSVALTTLIKTEPVLVA